RGRRRLLGGPVLTGSVLAALAVACPSGCSYDWTVPPASGNGDGDARASIDGGDDGLSGTADAGGDGDAVVDTAQPPGVCSAAAPCAAGTYCAYADTRCGTNETTGYCRSSPASCTSDVTHAYCGCDRQTYAGSCGSAVNRVDLNSSVPGCAPPANS